MEIEATEVVTEVATEAVAAEEATAVENLMEVVDSTIRISSFQIKSSNNNKAMKVKSTNKVKVDTMVATIVTKIVLARICMMSTMASSSYLLSRKSSSK